MEQGSSFVMKPGFSNPVMDSQSCFRILLDAMARPGAIHKLDCLPDAPKPLTAAAAAVCLTLLDLDTVLWLDAAADLPQVKDYLRFSTGCGLTDDPGQAGFGLITDLEAMPELSRFTQGTLEYPDRSASLIIQVKGLANQDGPTLRGPGINGSIRLQVDGLPDEVWRRLKENRFYFPLGVDIILATENSVACLPRTVMVED